MSAAAVVVVAAAALCPAQISVFDEVIIPPSGATVPTNAHLFLPLAFPLIGTLATPTDIIPLVFDAIPAGGVDLGTLPANTDVRLILDDGVNALPIDWHVSGDADLTPPVFPDGAVVTARVSDVDDFADKKVTLHVPVAEDDVAVAVYRAVADDGRVLVAAAPHGSHAGDDFVDIAAFVDTHERALDLTFTVVAVDVAGHLSDPSAPVTVHVPQVDAGGCGETPSSSSTSSWAVLLLAAIAGSVRCRIARKRSPV